MSDCSEILKKLSDSVCIGHIDDARQLACDMLRPFAKIERRNGNNTTAFIAGKSEYTVLIDAHIDEIGMIVTSVDERGFIKVAKAGGLDLRCLPSRAVTVHGKLPVPAVFCNTPPHISKDGDNVFDDISELTVDSGLGERASDIISAGDFVTFRSESKELCGTRITGKSLDNRAGVSALILLAKKLSEKKPPVSVLLLLSDQEELGLRGAKTAAFSARFDEAISVDVSFGNFPGINPAQCGNLGSGPMVGISPVLSDAISGRLCETAKKHEIDYQTEVMGGTTSTNADVISITRSGIPTGLVSIPLRNMHSDIEVVDTRDIESTALLLYKYIDGGALS